MSKSNDLLLKVSGMHCASCVNSIESGVRQIEGVESVNVNLATRSAVVSFENGALSQDLIIDKIKELGFNAEIGQPDILKANQLEAAESRSALISAVMYTIPLAVLAMWPMVTSVHLISPFIDGMIQAVLALLIFFRPGRSILNDAWNQTRHFRANMNSLIGMGTIAAFGWSLYEVLSAGTGGLYFDSVGMIISLILLGRFLEARSKGRAGEAIEALIQLQPGKTIALIEGVELEMDAAAARPGMILLVRPGERIPADGVVVDGSPVIDESMLTGESIPVEKKVKDEVIGGSLNGNRTFQMRVTRAGADSFLSRIINMVAEAQGKKAPVQKLADRVAGVFVPIVLGIAFLTLLIWYLVAPDSPLIIKSVISVLIIACPCALGLATPTAILAGTGRAARESIIIRGGDILEKLTEINTVIFDKTGTLTLGELEVAEVKTFGQISVRNLLRVVGSAEMQSNHPLGEAIVRKMKNEQIEKLVVKNIEAKPGFGLSGDYDGRHLLIGNKSLMDAEEISFGPALRTAEQEMEQGRTVIFAAIDGQVAGLLSLTDRLRPDARSTVDELKKSMERLDMLSGDNLKTASAVARMAGLDQFQAEIKPDQKKFIVDSYRKAGFRVAMIGDGINDAPALAAADVGIAVGNGTDVAIETADVILAGDNLGGINRMFYIARESMKVIKQNLFWAFFYNVIAIPIAAGALYPVMGLTLSPVIAAAAMAFSSIFVVTNSLRLNRLT